MSEVRADACQNIPPIFVTLEVLKLLEKSSEVSADILLNILPESAFIYIVFALEYQ